MVGAEGSTTVDPRVAEVVAAARAADVRLVRFEYCDVSGVARAKAIHVDKLAHKLVEGVGLTRAQDRLYVTHAARRFRHGSEREQSPTPFLEAIDVGPVDLVGISVGGMIAQTVAVRRPALVRSLTLVATLCTFPDDAV